MDTDLNFVFINETSTINDVEIKKNEIGIIESESDEFFVVNFVSAIEPLQVKKGSVTRFNPLRTGDAYEKKICNVCHRLLPVEDFEINQNGINNRKVRRPSCKECRERIDGTPVPVALKKIWEDKKPNNEIWVCPICKKKTIPGITSKVVLDHDHNTGQPRAWICDSCNTGLGRFKDDIEILENAIEYLKKGTE